MAWYRASGFGMFLHWGAYSHLAGRWKGQERTKDLWGEWAMHRAKIPVAEYEAMAKEFQPTDFAPQTWARVAKEAGMGWMVLTAKHHDGFAMYRSQVSPYNIVDHSGFSRDPVAELGAAARDQGLRFGVYYSHKIDWHAVRSKDPAEFERYFNDLCVPQVRELMTNYGPMDVLWFDIGVDKPKATILQNLVRGIQPKTLISSRIGGGLGDFTCTGDCEVPVQAPAGAWETCMTLSQHWSWYPQDTSAKTAAEVIHLLAEVRAKGGCLLLNVGPDNRGQLPAREVATLRQVGAWMARFGTSLREVTASPLAAAPWGAVTRAGDRLYLHLREWPVAGRVVLPGVRGTVTKAFLLGDPQQRPLPVTRLGDRDHAIDLQADLAPLGTIDPITTVVAVDLAPGATFDTTLRLDDDHANALPPSIATVSPGVVRKNIRSVSTSDLDPSMEWARYDDTATLAADDHTLTWTLRVPAPGDYHVLAEFAAETVPTGTVVVTCGTERLTATPQVGTWKDPTQRYAAQRLGTVSLAAAEPLTVTLQRQGANGPLLSKGLRLVPTRVTPLR